MHASLRNLSLLLFLALLSIFGSCRQTTKFVSGTVVKIADGDTITILDAQNVQHKIRLQGIDAPERRQDFSAVSREHLASLVFGKYVKIEYDKVDRYGRLVGKVWFDENDECLEQLRAGLAWHYKEYEKEQSPADQQTYANAEQEARNEKRGLWRNPAPTPPWEYRHQAGDAPEERDSSDQATDARSNLRNYPISPNSDSTNAPISSVSPVVNLGAADLIRGNKRTMIYHWPGCPYYDDIAPHNRVPFETREEAEKAGYRAARNCR